MTLNQIQENIYSQMKPFSKATIGSIEEEMYDTLAIAYDAISEAIEIEIDMASEAEKQDPSK